MWEIKVVEQQPWIVVLLMPLYCGAALLPMDAGLGER